MNGNKRFIWILSAAILCVTAAVLPANAQNHIFRKNEITKKQIALTFDDGPHPSQTEEILNILKENDVRATFFVIGVNVSLYPKALPKILEGGNEIGNHTYHHRTVRRSDSRFFSSEILQCERAIYETVEYRPKLFRPPGGLISEDVEDFCTTADYSVILWSIDTRDWSHRNADEIVSDVLTKIRPGDIILMHDYIAGYAPTADVIRKLIPELKRQGYEFCTVSELLQCQ